MKITAESSREKKNFKHPLSHDLEAWYVCTILDSSCSKCNLNLNSDFSISMLNIVHYVFLIFTINIVM